MRDEQQAKRCFACCSSHISHPYTSDSLSFENRLRRSARISTFKAYLDLR